jgi:hypothetical protein
MWRASSVMMQKRVISLAVPALVLAITSATSLAQSCGDPPLSEITQSQRLPPFRRWLLSLPLAST